MINVREVDRTFGLWAYLVVTGCASRDVEFSRSVTSHVGQRCQQADGLSADFNRERIHMHEFNASVEDECTFASTPLYTFMACCLGYVGKLNIPYLYWRYYKKGS
jgi:hypothetical protein